MDMNDNHKRAKLDVLKALRQVAMDLISEKAEEGGSEMAPEGLQKVAVMAKDKEGLEKGLDKAKEVLGSMPEGEDSEDEMLEEEEELHLDPSKKMEALAHEASESPEEQADEEEMLLKKLQELRNKKKMLKA